METCYAPNARTSYWRIRAGSRAEVLGAYSLLRVWGERNIKVEEGWLYVGIVSKDSPVGQGTEFLFRREDLVRAEEYLVVAALLADHPLANSGEKFRPLPRITLDPRPFSTFSERFRRAWENWQPVLKSWDFVVSEQIKRALQGMGAHQREFFYLWKERASEEKDPTRVKDPLLELFSVSREGGEPDPGKLGRVLPRGIAWVKSLT